MERCDTCSGPLTRAWWSYLTLDTVPAEVAAELLVTTKPPEDGSNLVTVPGSLSGWVFEDNRWAICEPCHELITDDDFNALVERYHAVTIEEVGTAESAEVKAALVRGTAIVAAFWMHRSENPRRCE